MLNLNEGSRPGKPHKVKSDTLGKTSASNPDTPVYFLGVYHHLHCVNDYLFTIKCSLRIAPSENTSDTNSTYWLTFTETYEL